MKAGILQFLKKTTSPITIGVQWSMNHICLLVLDNHTPDEPKIIDYVHYEIEGGKPSDELKKYIEEKSLHNTHCCLVLDDSEYQLLVVEPPNVPEEEMAEAIKWKIKDLIQFPVTDAVVDVFLQEDKNAPNKSIANVVVAQKNIIDKKCEWINDMGLNLVAIDIPELSYRNYLESTPYHDKNIALVLVKENYAKIMVVNHGSVLFSRGFTIAYKAGLLDDIPESDIVLELQRSLDYYERQLKQVMPSVICFMGENIADDKITQITTSSLNQEVVSATIEGFDFSEEDSLLTHNIAAVYGASLRKGLLQGASA